jgi:hypothetical protein
MVNLTNKLVASVKPPRDKKYIRLWDSNISGFGLRVTDKGVKSFFFEGRNVHLYLIVSTFILASCGG